MSSHQLLLGAGASIKDPDYLEELFKVHTYVGNNTTNNVQTKIDMGGRGAMVMIKNRDTANRHWNIFDTVRGPNSYLKFNNNAAGTDAANADMVSFNADGFTLGANSAFRYTNTSGQRYVSYTFKKRPRFFDIQTYTGDGNAGRQIPHDLEAIPACVWIKCTSHAGDWEVYHKEMSGTANATHKMQLNNNGSKSNDSSVYNNAAQNSDTHFTVGSHTNVNHGGRTYVMYLFANNEGAFNEKSQPIIHCGKYTGNSGDYGSSQDLGAHQESQFLLVKSMDHSSPWVVVDSRRGLVASTESGNWGESKILSIDTQNAESSANCFSPHGRGFQPVSSASDTNGSYDFLYLSITAETGATMKTPTSGDEVFDMSWTRSGASSTVASWGREGTTDEIKFPVDFAMVKNVDSTDQWYCGCSKLRGDRYFNTNTADALITGSYMDMSFMKGFGQSSFNSDALAFMWRRSPCFDVQMYTGGGQYHYHNLGQEPKMMWVKNIHHNSSWRVAIYYPASMNAAGNAGGSRLYADIGSNAGMTYDTSVFSHLGMWTSGTDKFLIWTDSSVAASGEHFMCYLFSELSGIAHFSYYIGDNTNTKTITTGFKPRFIMIKDIKDGASGTNWCIFGDDISPPTMWGTGNDNPVALNSTTAKSQNDFVHSFTSTGFSLKNTSSGDFHVNLNNGRYLCWAHA